MATIPLGRPIGDLLGDLLSQFQRLIRTEYLIARAEVGENLGKIRAGAVLLVVGAVLLLPALTILLWGIAQLLTRAGLAQDIATLLVGAVAVIVGTIVLMTGIGRVQSVNLMPEKTLTNLQRDAAAVNHGTHQHERAAA